MVISTKDLIEKLQVQLPMAMEYPDPITGEPFVVNHDNLLSLLVVDVDNLVLESQTVAMFYGEMARVHAAAKMAKEQADVVFRQWKAGKAAEARRTLDGGETAKGIKKPPSNTQVEEYYRGHSDYDAEYRKANRAGVIVDLLADLKTAFQMKQRAIGDLHRVTFGHDRVATAEDRMAELAAASEAVAMPMMEASADTLADIIATRAPHPGNAPATPPAEPVQTELPVGKTPAKKKTTKRARTPAKGSKS